MSAAMPSSEPSIVTKMLSDSLVEGGTRLLKIPEMAAWMRDSSQQLVGVSYLTSSLRMKGPLRDRPAARF